MRKDEAEKATAMAVTLAKTCAMTTAMALMVERGNPDRAIARLEAARDRAWDAMPFDGNELMIQAIREAKGIVEGAAER